MDVAAARGVHLLMVAGEQWRSGRCRRGVVGSKRVVVVVVVVVVGMNG